MHSKYLYLPFLLFFMFVCKVNANHITAGEFRYASTGKAQEYLVGLKIYRTCSGAEFCSSCPSSLSFSCSLPIHLKGVSGIYADSLLGNFTLQIVKESSAKDATWQCKHSQSICSNCGTRTPGTQTPGIEMYYFEGILDLSFLPQNCCQVNISYQNCCRNSAINNLFKPELENFFVEMELNRCLPTSNNSVVFLNNPILQTCTGSDMVFSQQANDPDGDSLSFHLIPIQKGKQQMATYVSPYTFRVPFPFFGAPDTSGFGLNPSTGELRFRAMGSFVSNFALEVREWRYVEGRAISIGYVVREFTLFGTHCPPQNSPNFAIFDSSGNPYPAQMKPALIFPPYQKTCYKIVAIDPERDTSDIYFNQPLLLVQKGLNLTYPYNTLTRGIDGPLNDTLQICWTPSLADANPTPYYFTLFAEDRACKPYESRSVLPLQFFVKTHISGLNSWIENEQDIIMYPNPSSHQVKIVGAKLTGKNLEINAMSMDGKKIMLNYEVIDKEIVLDVSSLKPGIWLFELRGEYFLFYLKHFHQN